MMKDKKSDNDAMFEGIFLYKPGVELPNLYHFGNQSVRIHPNSDKDNNRIRVHSKGEPVNIEKEHLWNRPIYIEQWRSMYAGAQWHDKHQHLPEQKVRGSRADLQSHQAQKELLRYH